MITIKALIKADVQKVWDYYTLPHHIIRWNFAGPGWHCPKAENDLRPGGTYKARMEAKDGSFGFDFEAVYTDVQPGKEFSYEFGGRKASVSFSKNGEETEIVICFDPETTHSIELQRSGWQSILNNFKSYTENN